ncbi:MAG TPA: YhcH/YjgK/YiaL family protein [Elusimicrobia bacterium]|nr:MAG: hypothetical protein A2089_13705 [Elusimicrobia bacterium GWD2_63_28]HCC48292.1 YhcH/YjgK/YiaL family protein [Elusimicrobiota bacterium]
MILTRLEHADRQVPHAPGLKAALAFLRRPGLRELPDGRYEIDGERVYAMVQRYSTAPALPAKFEAHRKFIDVQYLAAGAETIAWAPLDRVEIGEPYDGEKDACFGAAGAAWQVPAVLRAGELAVLYPEDAHAPRLPAGAPGPVVKVVVKVSIEAGL